jgi:hypothetical protein
MAFALLAMAVFPAAAGAHYGTATVSCTSATFTFTHFSSGSNTVNYKVTSDNTVVAQGTYVLAQGGGTSGSITVPLTIHDTHVLKAYSWWGPAGTATGETRAESSPPLATQSVTCAPTPPAPPPPVATSAPAPVAAAPETAASTAAPAATVVAGERVRSAPKPKLAVQGTCAASHARVTVRGRSMRQVRVSVRGRHVRTVNVKPSALSVSVLVPLRRSGPLVQRVTTRITFRNGTRATTLSAPARRCAPVVVVPKFTG